MNIWHSLYLSLLLIIATSLPSEAQTTYNWNGTTGNWTEASRWTPNGIPGDLDTAIVSGGTVTLDSPITVNTYRHSGGNLQGTGALTVTNNFVWNGGNFTNSITLNLQMGLSGSISGTSAHGIGGNATLNNWGTLNWSGTGGLTLYPGILNNYGIIDSQSDTVMQRGGGNINQCIFNNYGITRKSSGLAYSQFNDLTINNTGTFEALSGTMALSGPLTHSGSAIINNSSLSINAGGSGSGTFNSTAGGNVSFNGTTSYRLDPGTDFSGTGTLIINGAVSLGNASIGTPNLNLQAERLQGTGTLYVTNSFNWTGGAITNNAVLTLLAGLNGAISGNISSGSQSKSMGASAVLNNHGTLTWAGTGKISIYGGTWNNHGTLNAQSDDEILDPDSPTTAALLNNYGEIKKNSGAASTLINIALNNAGSCRVYSGTLRAGSSLNNSGSIEAKTGTIEIFSGSSSGAFLTENTGVMEFRGNSFNINEGSSFSGSGTNYLISYDGPLTLSTSVGMKSFFLQTGRLAGNGSLTVTNFFNWSGGAISNNVTLNILEAASGRITGNSSVFPATKSIGGNATVNNYGTISMAGNAGIDFHDGNWNNFGIFDLQTDAGITDPNEVTAARINNYGTLRKSGGSGTSQLQSLRVYNEGTLLNQTGTLRFGSYVTNSGTCEAISGILEVYSLLNYGTCKTSIGGTLSLTGPSTLNPGTTFQGLGTNMVATSFDMLTLKTNVGMGNLMLSSGGILGTNTLTVTNNFAWTGGVLTNGVTLELQSASSGTISGPSAAGTTIKRVAAGSTLNNRGTLSWSGGAIFLSTNVWNNYGTLDILSDTSFSNGGNDVSKNVFNNFGKLSKSGGTGTTSMQNMALTNAGILEVARGMIDLPTLFDTKPSSTYRFVIDGYTAGTGFGKLQRSSGMPTGNKLDIAVTNSFTPTNGALFQIIAGTPSPGVFATVTGRKYGDSQYFNVIPFPTGVMLSTANGKPTLQGGPSIVNEGKFRLQINGAVNEPYLVEFSTDLENWLPLTTNSIPAGGSFEYIDQESISLAKRFYRVIFVP